MVREVERVVGDTRLVYVPACISTAVAVVQWESASEKVVHGRSLHPHVVREVPSGERYVMS